jgi:serine protease Do
MDQVILMEAAERYLRGEMSPLEAEAFEALRRDNPDYDQWVVEHHILLDRMDTYAERKRFKSNLHDIHQTLQENGGLRMLEPETRGRLVELWSRYRRVVGVAASIGGVTALLISGLTSVFSPKAAIREVEELRRKVSSLEKQSSSQSAEINAVRKKIEPGTAVSFGGTGFLIDPSGYLVTSAHVLTDATGVILQNNAGHEYHARILVSDRSRDLAILKIEDEDFSPRASLPYGISRTGIELAEPVFTMGYPKDEVVYGEGYLSASSGLEGDTLSYQISISANPGNSGGPVINRKGEVIGILNARQVRAEGVVFAIRSRNIHKLVEEMKANDIERELKLSTSSQLKGLDRVEQVRRIQDCIYMVKVLM